MCYEENRERPLGVNEAEAAWLDQMSIRAGPDIRICG